LSQWISRGAQITVTTPLLSTREAAVEAQVTVRQLDHWSRAGVLTPTTTPNCGSGRHRLWTRDEANIIRLLGRLSKLHVPIAVLRQVAEKLSSVTIAGHDTRLVVVDRSHTEIVTPAALPRRLQGRSSCWLLSLAAERAETLGDDRPPGRHVDNQ
jgi:DNA-binding transcriptional MerR regulator